MYQIVTKISLLLLYVLSVGACAAQDSVKVKTNESITQHSQRLLTEKLGDSVACIIINAKKAEIICDSISKKLSQNEIEIAKYLVSDTCNFKKGFAVDGHFYNYLSIVFKTKKEFVTLRYDFVLDKLQISGSEDKLLTETDLTRYDIVNFGLLAFPDNKYLNRFKIEKK